MSIFVDTSALYALLVPEDIHHVAAQACFEDLRSAEASLVSTNYVLLECTSLLQRRHGFDSARTFLIETAALLDIIWVEKAHHEQAVRFWNRSRQRALSLVDCASFSVMEARGLRRAIAFDTHFRQAGFEVLPQADRVAERRGVSRATRPRRSSRQPYG